MAAVSRGRPSSTARAASSRLSAADFASSMCRRTVSTPPPSSSGAIRRVNSSTSAAMPSPVRAEISRIFAPVISFNACAVSTGFKSLLFRQITDRPSAFFTSSASPASSASAASSTISTTSARSAARCARSTPSFSMGSLVSRWPAVSESSATTPPRLIRSVSTSRVVPGMAVTMARSWFKSAFISEDLPTLGRPASTMDAPSRSTRAPRSSHLARSSERMARRSETTCSDAASSSTSSGKSVEASSSASTPVSFSDTPFTKADTPPSSCRTEARAAASPWAPISCITASARLRSMRPFKKARLVNSPGWAIRAPSARHRESTAPALTPPPWQWISATSSRV